MVYGRVQPHQTSVQSFGLGTCADRLCFLGIAPGITRWSKALAALEGHGATQRTHEESIYFIDHTRIRAEYDPQTLLVTYIGIVDQNVTPLPISLGDVVDNFGTLCGYIMDIYGLNPFALIYPNVTVYVDSHFSRLRPTTPISSIAVLSSTRSCDKTITWPGFTTQQRYLDIVIIAATGSE